MLDELSSPRRLPSWKSEDSSSNERIRKHYWSRVLTNMHCGSHFFEFYQHQGQIGMTIPLRVSVKVAVFRLARKPSERRSWELTPAFYHSLLGSTSTSESEAESRPYLGVVVLVITYEETSVGDFLVNVIQTSWTMSGAATKKILVESGVPWRTLGL